MTVSITAEYKGNEYKYTLGKASASIKMKDKVDLLLTRYASTGEVFSKVFAEISTGPSESLVKSTPKNVFLWDRNTGHIERYNKVTGDVTTIKRGQHYQDLIRAFLNRQGNVKAISDV